MQKNYISNAVLIFGLLAIAAAYAEDFTSCYTNQDSVDDWSEHGCPKNLPPWAEKMRKAVDLNSFPAGNKVVLIKWASGSQSEILKPFVHTSSGNSLVDLACLEAVCGSVTAPGNAMVFTLKDCSNSSVINLSDEQYTLHLIPTSIVNWCSSFIDKDLRGPSNIRILGNRTADPKANSAKKILLSVYADWTSFLLKNNAPTREQIVDEATRIEEKYQLGKGLEPLPNDKNENP